MGKIWRISQRTNNSWDTYDSAVVVADTEEDARMTHPNPDYNMVDTTNSNYRTWCKPSKVIVEYLGETDRNIKGVIVASFNAG